MGFVKDLFFGADPPEPEISQAPDPNAKPNAGKQPDTPRKNREDFDPDKPRATPIVNLSGEDDRGIQPINLNR